jgi:mRNA-degrading endonuclease toxin of MazEF toxin-antitoxin module
MAQRQSRSPQRGLQLTAKGPSTGDVFHVASFPGLHGNQPKDRFVIVVHPAARLHDAELMVVPTSSSSLSAYGVSVPNHVQNPGCSSGLPKVCKAICDQYRFVPAGSLTNKVGTVSRVVVERLVRRISEFDADKNAGKLKPPGRQ